MFLTIQEYSINLNAVQGVWVMEDCIELVFPRGTELPIVSEDGLDSIEEAIDIYSSHPKFLSLKKWIEQNTL